MIDDGLEVDETRRAIRLAALLVLLLCVTGVVGIWAVAKLELWRRSMFFEQFGTEGPGIAVIALAAIATYVFAGRPAQHTDDVRPWLTRSSTPLLLALGAFLIVRIGAAVAFHDYALVDDEFSGIFQATIYANGHAAAMIGQPWCQWADALTPTSIWRIGCQWQLSYFPVNALIRGAFMAVKAAPFMHPLMVAVSVILVYDICRRAWPAEPERATIAAVFLAASTQFLMMAMTAFAMPAHLLASCGWLWLYVRPERWALVMLPWLGVVALGVHSPYPHVFFVAPLVVRYLVDRRYRAFAYVSVVYVAGSLAWVTWLNSHAQPTTAAASAQAIASTASHTLMTPAGEPIVAALSTVIIATWNVPIALISVLIALLLWKRLDTLTRWIAVSMIFTIVARVIFFNTYGAGWGNRLTHAVLANVAIVAGAGVSMMARSLGTRRTYQLFAASIIVAIAVQLPLRAWQAARIVRPYERASAYLDSLRADVVILQFQSLQWGRQLLRNDPFLRNTPKLMDLNNLTPAAQDSLERVFPGRVRYVRPAEITALGVKAATRIGRFELRSPP